MASFTVNVNSDRRFDIPVKFYNMQTRQVVATLPMVLDTGSFNIIDGRIKSKLGLGPQIGSWGENDAYSVNKFLIQIGNLKPITIIGSIGPLVDIYGARPDIGLLGHCNNTLSQFMLDMNRDRVIISDSTDIISPKESAAQAIAQGKRANYFNIVRPVPDDIKNAIFAGNKPQHHVTFTNPKNNKSITLDTMIDTGVGTTALYTKYARMLGLNLESGQSTTAQTAQQTTGTTVFVHPLRITVGNLRPITADVKFFDGLDYDGVLGDNAILQYNTRWTKTAITYIQNNTIPKQALYTMYQTSRYRGRL